MTTRTFRIRVLMIVVFSTVSCFVIAATGGKKAVSKTTMVKKSTYRNFSLRSGFEFKGSKVLNLNKSNSQVQFNSLALIKKNNTVYGVPYTHKANIKNNNDQSGKKYTNVDVKIVNIRL
jgi:hypothetical protein